MIKRWIIKSNEWYDNLKEPKRTLFFFLALFLPLLIIVIVQSILGIWYPMVIWMVLFCIWRVPYTFISIKDTIESVEDRDY